ncbi:Co2+/Mg2+ efflux protein ApaG [Methylocaldum szegediense]|jgi:ApaG protein|uniref:Protein ApaG n=1 Tax=Methylocaldum szegediense TaxID=73780 RepID=A0ABN8XC68_9GAMM|nr:Co2+/Mg2+ efflux protein ApaG [Methylocaldum szegediense]CAI8964612.1 DUF525 domain-containing protein ApaG [Methylocaldum szegediense]
MASTIRELKVDVKTVYLGQEAYRDGGGYVFAYTVTMQNTGNVPARLLGRRWLITDANGKTIEVVGEGVVGEHPYLRPGEAFQYTSSTMIETPVGSMQGSYQLLADDGVPFEAPIPPFRLAIPRTLH